MLITDPEKRQFTHLRCGITPLAAFAFMTSQIVAEIINVVKIP
jgi:hypothetical protein